MSLSRAAGMPDYTKAGASQFIPEIWSLKMLEKFYKTTIWTAISNTDYEGEIKDQGDKVYVRTVPTITINAYVKGQKLNYERPESTATELLIDKGNYFAFTCDDVDAYQADIKLMNIFSQDAAEQQKIYVDAQVLQDVTYGSAGTFPGSAYNAGTAAGYVTAGYNLGTSGSPVQITKTNVIDYITDAMTVLDEQNVPESGRWMVIPHWVANLIAKSDQLIRSLWAEMPFANLVNCWNPAMGISS